MPLNKMQRQWSAWIFPYLFGFTVHNIELGAPPSTMYNIISCLGMNTLLHIDSSAHMYRVHLVAHNHRQLSLTKRGPKIMKLRSKLYSETDRISWVNTFCLYIERDSVEQFEWFVQRTVQYRRIHIYLRNKQFTLPPNGCTRQYNLSETQ